MSGQLKLKPAIVPVAHIRETKIPLSHVTRDLSHAIVNTSASETTYLGRVKFAVDMLHTGTYVRREGNLAMLGGKLVILLSFADQNPEQSLEQWLM